MSNTTRNDVKQLAEKIEVLAKNVQLKLDANADDALLLSVANELVRNNLTFVFTLGEFYALKQSGTNKKHIAKKVSMMNYHNVRDSFGRFTRKT